MRKYLRFYIYFFCFVFANSMVAMFLAMYLKSKNIGETNIGGVLGIYHLVMPLVILSFGFLADRFSCRRLIMLGSFISMIFCLLMPRLNDVRLMGIGVMLEGTGLMLCLISLNSLFMKTVEIKGRGRYMSFFIASKMTGYALGTATSGILIKQMNLPISIIFHVALPIHFACFLIATGLPGTKVEKFPIVRYLKDIPRVPVLCLALLTFSLGLHWGSEKFALVRYLNEGLSASGFQIAAVFIGVAISLAVFIRISGYLIDVRGNFIFYLSLGMVISGILHALTAATQNFPQFLIVRVLHTCGDGFIIFAVPMLVSVAFPRGRVGGNYGFNRMFNSIGGAMGSGFAGYLVAKYFLGSPFVVTGIIQVFTGVVIWMMRRYLPTPQGDRPESKAASTSVERD